VAVEQEILNLIYQYQGAEALNQAKKDLEAARAATAALGDQFKQGAIDEAAFRVAVQNNAKAISDAREKVEGLERAARGGASGMAGFGQSLLQSGRIVQDFTQGGIGGILNNIEGITMALGGPAGLAGILTIVGVGFYVLKPKIEEFMKSLLDDAPVTFADRLEEMRKRIKELEDKPHKIAVEVDELRDAKEQVEAIEAGLKKIEQMRKTQEYYERESGRQIAEIFAEEPGAPAAREALIAQEIARQREATPELTAGIPRLRELEGKVADLRRTLDEERAAGGITLERELQLENRIQNADRHRLELQNRLNTVAQSVEERATAEVGRIITQAEEGTGVAQQRAQARLAEELQRARQPDLAAAVQLSRPGVIQTEEQIDEKLEAGNAQAKRVREAQQKRARTAEQLNRQGRENQLRAADERQREQDRLADDLTRQGEQNQRASEQEARRQEQEAQAQARKSGAPYVPFAERALVELQAQGGVFDPHRGRVLPLNAGQQQAFVAAQAAQAVQARNPQMAPGMARDIGGRIAGMAAASLGKRQAQLTAQGVGHTDALMMITATLNNEQARLQQQLMRQGAQIQALGANVQARTKPAGRGPGRR
jgi:hypothetical protein